MRALMVSLLIATMATPALSGDLADGAGEALRYAEAAGVRALGFNQGELASLVDSEADFTPGAWKEFMKTLDGALDAKGAATFSSGFVPSGPALDVRRNGGMISLTIPGVLKHESRNQYGGVSTTEYRAEIDIELSESPLKIRHLMQRTCGGAKRQASCR